MSQEQLKTITTEAKDLMTEVYPETDARKLQEWLIGSTHGQSLIGELEKNRHDVKNAGISRLGILVEACANYNFRKDFDRDDRLPPDARTELGLKILETVAGGDKKKMAEIYNEGVEEVELAEGVNAFQIKDRASTELAGIVEEVVDEWVADSLQAQLRTVNLKYEAREQALRKANQRVEEAEKKGGGETWNDERRKEVKGIYEELPKQARQPIDNNLDQYIRESDQIKEVDREETEAPQNLEVAYQSLLRKFEDLEGVDIDALRRLGLTNKVVAHLPQILRLKLDERRTEQARQRQTNKEKKEVKGYFAEHKLKLVGESGIDETLQKKFQMARDLGVDALPQDQRIVMPTEFEEVKEVGVMLNKAGAVMETALTVDSFNSFDRKRLLWDELLIILDKQTEKTDEFKLTKQYSGDDDQVGSFVVKSGDQTIGAIVFDKDRIGKLIIKWERPEATNLLDTSVYLVNLLEKVEGEGNELKGLKLTAVVETEAVPTEPVEPAGTVLETSGSDLEVESPAPEPEKPTVEPKEAPEIPNWLRDLRSAPSQVAAEEVLPVVTPEPVATEEAKEPKHKRIAV